MERGVVRGQRLRRGHDQPPWLDRVRAEIYRRVNGDWGGKPFVDLMKGLDYAEKTFPFIDKTREAAMGASYGGYMANWILGHTDRFRAWCRMMECSTPNRLTERRKSFGLTTGNSKDRRGTIASFIENGRRTSTRKISRRRRWWCTARWITGSMSSQGFDLFTTLQRLKVPSKMLYFPDEGHWVLKPQNSRLWYKTVNDWVDQW